MAEACRAAGFIVDRIEVGILVVDREFRIQVWNQFMERHSGLLAEQVLGKNLFDTFPELPKPWLLRKINSVFVLKNFAFTSWEQRPYLFRFAHHRPITGGIDYMQQNSTIMPMQDETGEVNAVCISLFDVTDTAILQRQRADALAALEADTPTPSASPSTLTQQHALIRSADEYGDLFAHATTQSLESTQP